jgi:hypothetical protein
MKYIKNIIILYKALKSWFFGIKIVLSFYVKAGVSQKSMQGKTLLCLLTGKKPVKYALPFNRAGATSRRF